MTDTIGKGFIERFEGDVAWGSFDTGMTFGLPLNPMEHEVGDEVKFGTSDPEETGSTFQMLVIGSKYATCFWMEESEVGYEIVHCEQYSKSAN